MARVKYLHPVDAKRIGLEKLPRYYVQGLVFDIQKQLPDSALVVWSGRYLYDVSTQPEIYHNHAK